MVEIEYAESSCALSLHCKSVEHNSILEEIATGFVILHADKLQASQCETNYVLFKNILYEMQIYYPFSEFQHCLKYISFNSSSFICILCDITIQFSEDGSYVQGHLQGTLHRSKSLELVLKHISIVKNSFRTEKVLSSKGLCQNLTDDCSTVKSSPTIQIVGGEDQIPENNSDQVAQDKLKHSLMPSKVCSEEISCTKTKSSNLGTINNDGSDDVKVSEDTSTESDKEHLLKVSATERSSTDSCTNSEWRADNRLSTPSNDVSLNTAPSIIEVNGDSFICTICDCSLPSIHGQLSTEIIQTHVSSPEHLEKEMIYEFMQNNSLCSLIKSKVLMIFHENKQFIERSEHLFYCKMCNLDFANVNNDMLSHLNFAMHFETLNHREVTVLVHQHSDQQETDSSQLEVVESRQNEECQSELYLQKHHNVNSGPENGLLSVPNLGSVDVLISEDTSCPNDVKQEDKSFVCPECEENVEVYNNNWEFSVQFHAQKHKTLADANELAANEELLKNLGNQKSFVAIHDSDFFCDLCNCTITFSKNKQLALQNLKQHIKEPYHLSQYDLFLEETNTFSSNESITKTVQPNQDMSRSNMLVAQANTSLTELSELLGDVHNGVVKQNKEFVKVKENGLLSCSLCKISISTSPNPETNVKILNQHFCGYKHIQKLKRKKRLNKKMERSFFGQVRSDTNSLRKTQSQDNFKYE